MSTLVFLNRNVAATAVRRCARLVAEAASVSALPLYRVLLAGALTGSLSVLCAEAAAARAADVVAVAGDNEDVLGEMVSVIDRSLATLAELTAGRLGVSAADAQWETHSALFAIRVLSRGGLDTDVAAGILNDPAVSHLLPRFLRDHTLSKRIIAAPPLPTALVLLDGFVQLRAEAKAQAPQKELLRTFSVASAVGYCLSATGFLRGGDATSPAVPAILGALADVTNDGCHAVRLGRAAFTANNPSSALGGVLGSQLADGLADAIVVFVALAEQHALAEAPGSLGDLFRGRANLSVGRRPPSEPAALFARILECFAAALGAIMQGGPVLDAGEVSRHRQHIYEHFCQLSCPHCSRVFESWDGCFLVQCTPDGCGVRFCGWCLQECNGYDHVCSCEYNPNKGSWDGTAEQRKRVHRARTIRLTREYLQSTCSPPMRAAVVAEALTDLQDLGIAPDDVGVRPQLSPASIMQQANVALERVRTTLLNDATDAAAVWWTVSGLLDDPAGLFAAMAGRDATQFADSIPAAVSARLHQGRDAVAWAQRRAEQCVQQEHSDAAALQWNAEFEESVAALPAAVPARHFAIAQPRNGIELLLAEHDADGADTEETDDPLRPLRVLYDVSTRSPPMLNRGTNEAMCDILATAARIAAPQRSRQLSEAGARAMSVADAAKTAGMALHDANVFVAKMKRLHQHIKRWNCQNAKSLKSLFPDEIFKNATTLPLAFILPSSEGAGLLLQVLLCGTNGANEDDDPDDDDGEEEDDPNGEEEQEGADEPQDPDGEAEPQEWRSVQPAQAQVLRELRMVRDYPVTAIPTSSMMKLHPSRLITHDPALLRRLLPLYIDPTPVPAISDDIATLQALVVHTPGVWGKPMLSPALPLFPYSDTEGRSVFQRLVEICPPESMSRDVHQQAVTLLAMDPAMPSNMAMLLMLLVQDATASVYGRTDVLRSATLVTVAKALSVPLTAQQQMALSLLQQSSAATSLRLNHAVDLLQLCLSDVPVRDAVTDPLPEDLSATLEREATAAAADIARDLDGILFGFRRLMLERLTVPQNDAFYNSCLSDVLDLCLSDASAPTLEALPSLETATVRNTVAAQQVLAAAWRDRRRRADDDEDATDAHRWVVPFTQLRKVVVVADSTKAHRARSAPSTRQREENDACGRNGSPCPAVLKARLLAEDDDDEDGVAPATDAAPRGDRAARLGGEVVRWDHDTSVF